MVIKLNLIVAVCENMGIGINGKLPWKLKSEMAYFKRMTLETQDPNKKNVTLMGRKSWECIPPKHRPLANRVNLVLTRNPDFKADENVIVRNSLDSAIETLLLPKYQDKIESVWVIGGSQIYKEAMKSKYFYRLYLTEIKAKFDCDTYFSELTEDLKIVQDARVPTDMQEEDGIQFEYKVYENPNFGL